MEDKDLNKFELTYEQQIKALEGAIKLFELKDKLHNIKEKVNNCVEYKELQKKIEVLELQVIGLQSKVIELQDKFNGINIGLLKHVENIKSSIDSKFDYFYRGFNCVCSISFVYFIISIYKLIYP